MTDAAAAHTPSDIDADILAILSDKGRVARDLLNPEAKLAELGIASLDVIEVVFALEDRFDIEIPFNANDARQEFSTVGDVLAAVRAAVATKSATNSAA